MSEESDASKVVRLPVVAGRSTEASKPDRRDALREEILELLEDAASEPEPKTPPPHEPEWIPATAPKLSVPPPYPDAPPAHHRNAIECPQCDRWTWRGTDHCRWCGYSLADYYTLIEEEKQARRQERLREYAIELRRKMLLWAAGLLLLGVTVASNSSAFPPPMQRFVVYVGFLLVAAGAIVTHFLPK